MLTLFLHPPFRLFSVPSVFGIPIGVLGAGFEAIVSSENQDNTEELQRGGGTYFNALPEGIGSSIERACYHFVNGLGSVWAARFELMIYALILLSVAVGAWQTVPGQENSFHEIEWIAVVLFTIEYCLVRQKTKGSSAAGKTR